MEMRPDSRLRQSRVARCAGAYDLPTPLRTGIPFLRLAADRRRLRIGTGTHVVKGRVNYQAGAVMPNQTWRKPTSTEIHILKAKLLASRRGFISVINCHVPSIVKLCQKVGSALAPAGLPRKIQDLTNAECEEILRELREHRGL